jgi:hypothetical protein
VKHRHEGGCHCGALRWTLATDLELHELPARACQCSFCRAHGALSTSDPQGEMSIAVAEPSRLVRYRFATRSADFLICARCGVYVGAAMEEGGRWYAIANLNTLDRRAELSPVPKSMDYSGEDLSARRSRRAARWTPIRGRLLA